VTTQRKRIHATAVALCIYALLLGGCATHRGGFDDRDLKKGEAQNMVRDISALVEEKRAQYDL